MARISTDREHRFAPAVSIELTSCWVALTFRARRFARYSLSPRDVRAWRPTAMRWAPSSTRTPSADTVYRDFVAEILNTLRKSQIT